MAGILGDMSTAQKLMFALSGLGSGGQGRMSNMLGIHQLMLERAKAEKEEKAQQSLIAAVPREMNAQQHLGTAVNPMLGRPTPGVAANPMNEARLSVGRMFAMSGSPQLQAFGLGELMRAMEPQTPYTLAPGAQRRDPRTNAVIADNQPTPSPSPLARLQAERAEMPEGDPRIAQHDAAIAQATRSQTSTPSPQTPRAKLKSDLDNKFITQDQYNTEIARIDNPRGKPLTAEQQKAQKFHVRMSGAEKEYSDFISSQLPKGADEMAVAEFQKTNAPTVIELQLPKSIRASRLSPIKQRLVQAQEEWVNAFLRNDSGAAIGEQEMFDNFVIYFPMPGEDASVISAKSRARQRAMQSVAGEFATKEVMQYNPDTGQFE